MHGKQLKKKQSLIQLITKNRRKIMIVNKFNDQKYRKALFVIILIFSIIPLSLLAQSSDYNIYERRILVSEYRDKMMAGWIGQMVGVGWGAPTEFQFVGKIIPEDKVPEWKPEMVNVFNQDDLYVEMTFIRSLEEYGFDVSMKQAGIDFANSGYMLWHANRAGRENLRNGIAPPNSGHPNFNKHADDIDYQIEADFSGLIAPGLPNTVIGIGEKFGRLMNYGDGLYGGQFVGGLYAEAFFEDDPIKIVKAALKYIPEGSQYAEAVRDVIKWHSEQPDDWEASWELINAKYHKNPDYRQFTCSDAGKVEGVSEFNIDAKLNGAYIVMGLLYGDDDLDKTTIIAMRCGQDSDCNPSNAAGALFTTRGFKNLPEKFVSGLNNKSKFSFTDYSFPELVDVTEKLATDAIIRAGGRVEVNANGEKEFVIPIQEPKPSKLEQSHVPGPISDSNFTKEELKQIEGHWLFKFSLVFLVMLVFIVFKENQNLKAALILIPLAIIVILAELIKSIIDPEMLGMVNIIIVFESLAAAIAILLLIGKSIFELKWYLLILVAAFVLAIVGYAGVVGDTEGRYLASTDLTLKTYALQAILWLLALLTTTIISHEKYKHIKFNLVTIVCLFIFHVFGMFLIALALGMTPFGEGLTSNYGFIFIGALIFTLIHYLITLPFLILAYKNKDFGKRLMNWLKVT